MAAVRSERIDPLTGLHDRRVLAWLGSPGGDALAGRLVCCAAALPGGHAAGRRLGGPLHGDLEILPLAVEGADPAARTEYVRGAEPAELITAFLPAARLLDIREVPRGGDAARPEGVALAWTSLLGDILEEDRADHVGGTIQVRPVVAAR
jgi:hypothetical protein